MRELVLEMPVQAAGAAQGELSRRELGAGQPLILLNGYAGSANDWDPGFLEALAGGDRRLICPDHRGIGGSSADPQGLSIELMAADALAAMDDAAIERAPLVGWSMGSFVAQALAAAAPERVSALGLLASDPGGAGAVRAEARTWAALTDHGGSPREQASRLCRLLFPEPTASEVDANFGEAIAAARAGLSAATLSAQEAAMRAWHTQGEAEVEARLAAIQAPVLCVAGAEDIVIPPHNSEALASRLSHGSSRIFAGGGHAFMAQEPAAVAALLREFIAEAN